MTQHHDHKALPEEFLRRLTHCLQEEEIDVYVLNLYYRNSEDMKYFHEKDRERVQRIFDILIQDTKSHAELLKLIIDMGNHKNG